MGIQDIVALTIAAGAAVYAVRSFWKTMSAGGCGKSCAPRIKRTGTDAASASAPAVLKRIPFVPLEQLRASPSPAKSNLAGRADSRR